VALTAALAPAVDEGEAEAELDEDGATLVSRLPPSMVVPEVLLVVPSAALLYASRVLEELELLRISSHGTCQQYIWGDMILFQLTQG
jgi:hypothetical protein